LDGASAFARGLIRVADPPKPGRQAGEILVEFVSLGNSVKVTAIDTASGIEASIVGPAGAPRSTLVSAAKRKLDFLMKKRSS
jgi:uncharacterized protein DUF6898